MKIRRGTAVYFRAAEPHGVKRLYVGLYLCWQDNKSLYFNSVKLDYRCTCKLSDSKDLLSLNLAPNIAKMCMKNAALESDLCVSDMWIFWVPTDNLKMHLAHPPYTKTPVNRICWIFAVGQTGPVVIAQAETQKCCALLLLAGVPEYRNSSRF